MNAIDPKLTELHDFIGRAVFPEDVFGKRLIYYDEDEGEHAAETADEAKEALSKVFKEWQARCTATNFSGQYAEAYVEEAVSMLKRLLREGEARIDNGEYGEDLSSDFCAYVNGEIIELRKFLTETDSADIYTGSVITSAGYGKKIIAKIAKNKEMNRFLENELRIMRVLQENENGRTKHLQPASRTFKTSEGTLGCIADFDPDFYSLREVRESPRWKNGVPEKHMVWMLNRALSAIGFAHTKNIIHRDLNPDNILVRPRDHNLALINWDKAIANAHTNDGEKATGQEIYQAPELISGETAIPSTDLYAIGKCMIYMLGGDPACDRFPEKVNPKIISFLKAFVLPSKWQRIGDAWSVHGELIKLVESLWGPRRFLKFSIY